MSTGKSSRMTIDILDDDDDEVTIVNAKSSSASPVNPKPEPQVVAEADKNKTVATETPAATTTPVTIAEEAPVNQQTAATTANPEIDTIREQASKQVQAVMNQAQPRPGIPTLHWSIDYIDALNSDSAAIPDLNNNVRLMQLDNDGELMSPIIGNVSNVPVGQLVVLTNRAIKKGEIVTFVPIDYVRMGRLDVVYDVHGHTIVKDEKLLKRFETNLKIRPGYACILRNALDMIWMSDVKHKNRPGSFLGAYAGENLVNHMWMRAYTAIASEVEQLVKSGQLEKALRLVYVEYLKIILPRMNVDLRPILNQNPTATGKAEVLPLLGLFASCDIAVNMPIVMANGLISRICGIENADVNKRLYQMYNKVNMFQMEKELVAEVTAAAAAAENTTATQK